MSLLDELKKRHLLQIALVYIGAAWVCIEITQFVVGNYGLSRKLLDTVLLLAILGFPAFLVIGWYHGEKGRQRIRRGEASLLLTLAVLGAIGTYQIATGETPEDEAATVAGDPPQADAGLAAASGAPDLGRRSLAVLPFRNNVADPDLAWMGPGLADLLTTNFARIPDLAVVGRQSLYDLLTEEGRTEAEEIPESLALTVARAAGARMMVWGAVSGTPDDLVIDAQLIEIETGQVVAAERARGSDVFELVDTLTDRLMARVGGDRGGAPSPRIAMSRLGTRDMEALGAFQQGVAAEREGRTADAESLFQRALSLDSTFVLPLIRLAAPGEIPQDSPAEGGDWSEVEEIIGTSFETFDPEQWDESDWAALDPAERSIVIDALGRRELMRSRRVAESHRARALRVLEGLGDDLRVGLEGVSEEEFIFRFDSTLGRALLKLRDDTLPEPARPGSRPPTDPGR